MDLFGVDISLILSGPFMVSNDEVAVAQAKAPDRLIGLAKNGVFLPPFANKRQVQAAADEIEHGLRDLKLKGVAELSLSDWLPASLETAVAEMQPWFKLCAQYGDAPVMVHAHAGSGAADAAYCDPESYRPLARDFPTVPLVLCHKGGARRDFFDNALALAHDHDNVFFNTSQTLPEHLSEAVQKVGAEGVFFGVERYALQDRETKARSHVGKYLPGNPTVVAQSMPGAASYVAANHIYSVAPKDGTVMGIIGRTALPGPIISGRTVNRFDFNLSVSRPVIPRVAAAVMLR